MTRVRKKNGLPKKSKSTFQKTLILRRHDGIESFTTKIATREGKNPIEQRKIFVKECLADITAGLTTGPVRVMSLNAYYGRVVDPNRDYANYIDPSHVLKLISKMLDKNIDVIGVQEVCPEKREMGEDELMRMKERYGGFGEEWQEDGPLSFTNFQTWVTAFETFRNKESDRAHIIFTAARDSSMWNLKFGNLLVINKNSNTLVNTIENDCLLPTISGDTEGRACTACIIDNAMIGKVIVANTHFTEKVVGKSGERQFEMANALTTFLDDVQRSGDCSQMVLCGDFNVNASSLMIDHAKQICLRNPFLHPHNDCDMYIHMKEQGWSCEQDKAREENKVVTTGWNAGSIDHVFYKNVKLEQYAILPPKTKENQILSDHCWVAGTFSN